MMINRKSLATILVSQGCIASKLENPDEVAVFFENLFHLTYRKSLFLLNKCMDKTNTMGEAKVLFCNCIAEPDIDFGLEETEECVSTLEQLDSLYLNYDFTYIYETDEGLVKLCDPVCEHYAILDDDLTKVWEIITNIKEDIHHG